MGDIEAGEVDSTGEEVDLTGTILLLVVATIEMGRPMREVILDTTAVAVTITTKLVIITVVTRLVTTENQVVVIEDFPAVGSGVNSHKINRAVFEQSKSQKSFDKVCELSGWINYCCVRLADQDAIHSLTLLALNFAIEDSFFNRSHVSVEMLINLPLA